MAVSRNGAEPVAPGSVDGPGLPPGAAESNARFLGDIGLLVEEMPGRFKPTPVAMQLINTILADESRGRRLLRSIVEKTWFGRAARSFLATENAPPASEEDLVSALGAAAQVPEGAEEPALRLLVECLVDTGIFVRPAATVPRLDPATGPPSPTRAVAATRRTARTEPPPASPLTAASHAAEEGRAWEVIETSEFSLRIRPSAAAIRRLRKQLDLLDERLEEAKSEPRR